MVALLAVATTVACSNKPAPCGSPASGSFSLSLGYSQRVTAAVYCAGDATDTNICSTQAPPFGGATWNLAVDGSTATVTAEGGASWSCGVIAPESSPSGGPDGSTLPATGCYLLVSCGEQSVGDAGTASVQIQLLPPGSSDASPDVIAIVSESTGGCCTYEYTGSYGQQ